MSASKSIMEIMNISYATYENVNSEMNATTTLPASAEPGFTDQVIAGMSWNIPHARTPTSMTIRRSTYRTNVTLNRAPRRPIHVIITEYANGLDTPAILR